MDTEVWAKFSNFSEICVEMTGSSHMLTWLSGLSDCALDFHKGREGENAPPLCQGPGRCPSDPRQTLQFNRLTIFHWKVWGRWSYSLVSDACLKFGILKTSGAELGLTRNPFILQHEAMR